MGPNSGHMWYVSEEDLGTTLKDTDTQLHKHMHKKCAYDWEDGSVRKVLAKQA